MPMELSAMWAIILAVCGGILTIINTIDKVVGAGKAINAPNGSDNADTNVYKSAFILLLVE